MRLVPIIAALLVTPVTALAADDDFQNHFSQVCGNPTGALAIRCGETPMGSGALSGASQSSLNPSQTLAGNDATFTSAYSRHDAAPSDGVAVDAVDLGPFSLLVNAATIAEDFSRSAGDAERGYRQDLRIVEVGSDFRFGARGVVGAWLHWRRSDLEFDADPGFLQRGGGGIDEDDRGVSLFAAIDLTDRVYLNATLGYVDRALDLERLSVFQPASPDDSAPALPLAFQARTDGREVWAAFEPGVRFDAGPWAFDVRAALGYADSQVDDYRETDPLQSGLALTVRASRRSSLSGTVGASASRALSVGRMVLVPTVRLDYTRELVRDAAQASATYLLDLDRTPLLLDGDPPDRDFVDAALGVVAVFENGWSAFVDVQSTLGREDLDRLSVTAGLRVEL